MSELFFGVLVKLGTLWQIQTHLTLELMMKIQILPEKPLSPLNELFPQGVPVKKGVEVCVHETEAYLFDPLELEPETVQQVIRIAMADNMPVSITFMLLSDSELIIPKEWTCGT